MSAILKEGVLEFRKKSKLGKTTWKVIYAVVTAGAFHVYKDASDAFPDKSLNLENSASEDADKGKPFSFVFKTKGGKDDGKSWGFAGENEADTSAWLEIFKQAQTQKFSPPPKRGEAQRTKGSLMFRAKKNISGKVATSALMKQKVMNEETRHLLDALVAVVERVTDAKTAAEVEKQIIKMVLKGYFQYDKGTITMTEFKQIDGVLRKAFNQIDKLFGYYQVRAANQLNEGFQKTAAMLKEASQAVLTLLEPHVRAENIAKMKAALNVIADADFLYKVWDCPTLEADLLSLISAMNKYTQIEL